MKSLTFFVFLALLLSVPIYGQENLTNGDFRTMADFDIYAKKFAKGCDQKYNYTDDYINEFKHYIFRASLAFDIKANSMFSCLIFQESQFDDTPHNRLSNAGGLGQILPGTALDLHRRYLDPSNPVRIKKFDSMWADYCASCRKDGKQCEPCPPKFEEKSHAQLKKQVLTPHLAMGYSAMNLIDSLDQLKTTFCGNRYRTSKIDIDCDINLNNKKNLVHLYSAAVVAYNRGIGTVLNQLRDKKTGKKVPIDNWTRELLDLKVDRIREVVRGKMQWVIIEPPVPDSEAIRHTISLQRCLLSDEARKKSDIPLVREAEGPYREVGKFNKIFCNQDECGGSEKAVNSCNELNKLKAEEEKRSGAKK